MTQLWTFAILGLLNLGGNAAPPVGELVSWQQAKLFDVPTQPDPVITDIIEDYLDRLQSLGYQRDRQGIWLQSEWAYLGYNQEDKAFPAASLTKVATSLAALTTWNIDHRFVTRIYTTGPVKNGILNGDLVVEAGGNPLFVWEEAIAIGNAINQRGITTVTGDLVVVGNLAMNFRQEPGIAGALFKQAINADQWSGLITTAHGELPLGTPKPTVNIEGGVRQATDLPPGTSPLLEHQSPTLAQLLKQMNIYSNNEMAEMLATELGGTAVVTQTASKLAAIPFNEIQLINGSGLGVDNRLSPKAVTRLYQVISAKLAPHNMDIDDIFPVMGRDRQGTLEWRSMPDGLAVKTGTLNQVSALAGTIPTAERGTVWFSIINGGSNFDRLRAEQDKVLQRIAQHWQVLPTDLNPSATDEVVLGDPDRIQLPVTANNNSN